MHHKLSVSDALSATQNPCSRQNIYVQLHKRGYIAKSTITSSVSSISDTDTGPSTSQSPGNDALLTVVCNGVLPHSSSTQSLSELSGITSNPSSSSVKDAPSFSERMQTNARMKKEMNKRPRKTAARANRDYYKANMIRRQKDERYSFAFKKITAYWKIRKDDNLSAREVRRQGVSIQKICDEFNKKYLNLPGDKLLKRNVVTRAVKEGRAGESPKKNGQPPKVPFSLLRTSNLHITLMQASGDGEADKKTMVAAIGAAIIGTKFEGNFSPLYAWENLRCTFP